MTGSGPRLSLLMVAGMVCVWGCGEPVPPTAIPRPDLSGVTDERLVQTVLDAQSQVEDAPQSGEAWGQLGDVYLVHEWGAEAAAAYRRGAALNPEEFRWVYFLARSLERTDVGAAATAYSQALELDPSYLSARDAYARALRELGRAVDAREVLEVTLELNPGNARAELALGELDLQDQAFETARENLERALELDPQRIETHRALAQVYLVLGDREAANRHAQASQEDRPERILPDPVFDEVGAAGVTRYWLTVRANRYLASNQPERALEEFARAASDDEPNPMFWYNYGNALLRTGRYDEAVSTYERAVGLIDDASPVVRRDQEARFYSNLGLASANAGLLESAEENLLRALELSPSSDSEINNLVVLYRGQGRLDDAIRLLEGSALIATSERFQEMRDQVVRERDAGSAPPQ